MSLQTTACRVGYYVALGQNLYFDGRGAWLVQTEGGWVNLDDLVNQTGDQAQNQDRPPADSEEPDLLDLKFDAWRLCVNNHMNSVWLGGTGGVPLHVACPMPSI